MLDHLRHLLVESPELKIRGLHGGLGIWFLKNTSMIVDEANGASDDWQRKNAPSLHNQIVQILDYIDGKAFVQTDVPPGTPLLADAHSTQIAVLGPSPHDPDPPGYSYNNEVPPGYVYLIAMHMNGAILSPRSTSDQRKLALQISTALNEVQQELEQVRQDARQLVRMTNAQLLAPSSLSLVEDMLKQAQYAYTGQPSPSTKPAQGGALWIYDHLQRLATFDVKTYVPIT
jgi:hypothetical protein